MAVEAGLSVYVVGGQGVRLFVVVMSCGVLDVFLLGGFLSRHVCDVGVSGVSGRGSTSDGGTRGAPWSSSSALVPT